MNNRLVELAMLNTSQQSAAMAALLPISSAVLSTRASNSLLGVSLSYGDASLDYSGLMLRSSGTLTVWRAKAYGEQRFGSGFVEAMLSMARYDSDSLRNTGVGGANGQVAE